MNNNLLLKISIIIALFLLSFSDYESRQNRQVETNQGKYQDILGCWKGKPTGKFSNRNEDLRLISLQPDGTPAITLIFESGSRARVRDYDLSITYQDGAISWKAHTGYLNASRDTMRVVKEWKREKSSWIFVRQREADEFMRRLKDFVGKAYAYQIPDSLDDG